jgi:hypothetical protein
MIIDTLLVVKMATPQSFSIYELLKVIAPALAALVVGIISYFGINKTSKNQIKSSISIARYQLFGDIVLNSKNKWKDDLMELIAKILTEVDPDARPTENGRLIVNLDRITHIIFRIQLMLNTVKYRSHKALNDNLTYLGQAMAGYNGKFPKEELLRLQDSIFKSAKVVGKEAWDEIQELTKSTNQDKLNA